MNTNTSEIILKVKNLKLVQHLARFLQKPHSRETNADGKRIFLLKRINNTVNYFISPKGIYDVQIKCQGPYNYYLDVFERMFTKNYRLCTNLVMSCREHVLDFKNLDKKKIY